MFPFRQSRRQRLGLTADTLAAVESLSLCLHCGGIHPFTCPYIATYTDQNGSVTFNRQRIKLIDHIIYEDDIAEAKLYLRAQPSAGPVRRALARLWPQRST